MSLLLLRLGFAVYAAALLVAVVGLAVVLRRDATYRGVPGSVPTYWAIGSVVIPFVIVPLYAYYARRLGTRSEPVSARERWTLCLYGAGVGSLLVGGWLSPPDPVTQLLAQLALFVTFGILLSPAAVRLGR